MYLILNRIKTWLHIETPTTVKWRVIVCKSKLKTTVVLVKNMVSYIPLPVGVDGLLPSKRQTILCKNVSLRNPRMFLPLKFMWVSSSIWKYSSLVFKEICILRKHVSNLTSRCMWGAICWFGVNYYGKCLVGVQTLYNVQLFHTDAALNVERDS